MRLDAHLTGRQLAKGAGWAPSKVSKIEAGRQTQSDGDLNTWAEACGQANVVPELIASLRSLEQRYVEFRRISRYPTSARRTRTTVEVQRTLARLPRGSLTKWTLAAPWDKASQPMLCRSGSMSATTRSSPRG